MNRKGLQRLEQPSASEQETYDYSNSKHWELIVAANQSLSQGRSVHFRPDQDDVEEMHKNINLLSDPVAFKNKLMINGLVMLNSSPDKYFTEMLEKEAVVHIRIQNVRLEDDGKWSTT